MTPEVGPAAGEERFAGSEVYLEMQGEIDLDARRQEFDSYLGRVEKFRELNRDARILEVGVGTGWFLVMCMQRGLSCTGLELNPINLRFAQRFGREHGLDLDIKEGSIEDADIGRDAYDVVFAMSVFEHVQRYREGLENVYRALKPGGAFYFYSTNKFSPKSGEYHFPLYGWLPDRARYRLRIARQGESIMQSSGIDFNQFTYAGLRREFREIGFSRVVDQYDFIDVGDLAQPTPWKRAIVRSYQRVGPLKELVRVFSTGTCFICVK